MNGRVVVIDNYKYICNFFCYYFIEKINKLPQPSPVMLPPSSSFIVSTPDNSYTSTTTRSMDLISTTSGKTSTIASDPQNFPIFYQIVMPDGTKAYQTMPNDIQSTLSTSVVNQVKQPPLKKSKTDILATLTHKSIGHNYLLANNVQVGDLSHRNLEQSNLSVIESVEQEVDGDKNCNDNVEKDDEDGTEEDDEDYIQQNPEINDEVLYEDVVDDLDQPIIQQRPNHEHHYFRGKIIIIIIIIIIDFFIY